MENIFVTSLMFLAFTGGAALAAAFMVRRTN